MSSRQQTFDSNGPDIRIRGNAYQVLEKYLAMARDATSAGDRIAAENFYQHAEHYYRIINANGGDQGQNGRQRQPGRPDGQDMNGADGQPESAEGDVNGGNRQHQGRQAAEEGDDEADDTADDSA